MKRKKLDERPVLSFRVSRSMHADIVREAAKRRIRVSEEIERRLIYYEQDHVVHTCLEDAA